LTLPPSHQNLAGQRLSTPALSADQPMITIVTGPS